MDKAKLTTEKKLEIIEQISSLADGVTLEYVRGLSEVVCDPDTELDEKRKAYREMDKVLRIAKQYSDRVLLAEGKTTANIGIDGKGGLPFKFVINKHYPEGSNEQSADSEQQEAESDEQEDCDE
ncbi:MAG: hypothetical protein FVQ82_17400 [Planctomycetes bacterium]|nr:hypothetical protein [Planctomycetota bacterium]